ncbi:hypothetical protein TNCV_311761 [Trichonephila clavipes]|nr:hypothetical protein TNCV_311761 [Trichonephila clavipes]
MSAQQMVGLRNVKQQAAAFIGVQMALHFTYTIGHSVSSERRDGMLYTNDVQSRTRCVRLRFVDEKRTPISLVEQQD